MADMKVKSLIGACGALSRRLRGRWNHPRWWRSSWGCSRRRVCGGVEKERWKSTPWYNYIDLQEVKKCGTFIYSFHNRFTPVGSGWIRILSQEHLAWLGNAPSQLQGTMRAHTMRPPRCQCIYQPACFWEAGGNQGTQKKPTRGRCKTQHKSKSSCDPATLRQSKRPPCTRLNHFKTKIPLGSEEPVSYSFLDHDNMNGLAPRTSDTFYQRSLQAKFAVANGWFCFLEAQGSIREECAPLIFGGCSRPWKCVRPPSGLFSTQLLLVLAPALGASPHDE